MTSQVADPTHTAGAPDPSRAVRVSPDVLLATLALGGLVFVPVLKTMGALIFLVAGCVLMARRPGQGILAAWRHWPVLTVPVFCLASAVWSDYPPETFRFALQLLATFGIALVIGTRLDHRSFGIILFVLFSAAMVGSLLSGNARGDTGALLGLYGSKNAFAGAATIFVVLSVARALDSGHSLRFRALAAGAALTGLGLVVMAQSASALLVLPPALALQLGLYLVHRLRPVEGVVLAAFTGLLLCLAALLAVIHADAVIALLLETTGKDMTLTGRTDLWQVALGLIAEKPVFGHGYQAFWIRGNADAEALWSLFGIESRSGFNFHNMYLSNAVEIGLAGVVLQVFVLYGALAMSCVWALRRKSADAGLLCTLTLMVVMVSFVEVPVFFQFSLRSVIVVATFVFATRGLWASADRTAGQSAGRTSASSAV